MSVPSRFLLPLLLVLGLLQSQIACHGGHGGGSVAAPDYSLSLAGGAVNLAAGSSSQLTVLVVRSNGHAALITLSVEGLPSGVTASGSIPPGSNSGSLNLSAASNAATATLQSLVIKGSDGTLSHSTPTFTLNVFALQPGTNPGTNLVHASGGAQSGQGIQNAAIVGEPLATVHSASAGTENRTGFTPPQPQ